MSTGYYVDINNKIIYIAYTISNNTVVFKDKKNHRVHIEKYNLYNDYINTIRMIPITHITSYTKVGSLSDISVMFEDYVYVDDSPQRTSNYELTTILKSPITNKDAVIMFDEYVFPEDVYTQKFKRVLKIKSRDYSEPILKERTRALILNFKKPGILSKTHLAEQPEMTNAVLS